MFMATSQLKTLFLVVKRIENIRLGYNLDTQKYDTTWLSVNSITHFPWCPSNKSLLQSSGGVCLAPLLYLCQYLCSHCNSTSTYSSWWYFILQSVIHYFLTSTGTEIWMLVVRVYNKFNIAYVYAPTAEILHLHELFLAVI